MPIEEQPPLADEQQESLSSAEQLLDDEMTPAELAEAQAYGRRQLAWDLVGRGVDLVYLVAMVFVVLWPSGPVVAWVESLTSIATLQVAIYFLAISLGETIVSLPLSYFGGYRLEHAYGLSRLTLPRWLWKKVKQLLLGAAVGVPMMLGLYWTIWLTGGWWWLVAAAAFFLVSIVLGQLAPVLILPLFYKIERLEDDAELTPRMNRLAAGTGLSIEGVYRMRLSDETVKANAMLAGLGRTRRVIMGDTLLSGFTPDEIEVIFAHEIGHHVFGHIRKLILFGVVVCAAGFLLAHFALSGWLDAFEPGLDFQQLPAWSLPMLLLAIHLFSIVVEPVQNILSRRFERQCDRYALERSGKPAAYLSAFRKLSKLNKDDPSPHPLEVFLFHSHPPIAERLAMADHDATC